MVRRPVPDWIVVLASLIMVLAIGAVDALIEPNFAAAELYLIPVCLCAWWLGRSFGTWLVVASAVLVFALVPYAANVSVVVSLPAVVVHLVHLLVAVLVLSRLREALDAERRLARTDPLTGVANTRQFYERMRIECDRARREGSQISIAYLDVDDFKTVNDRLGHREGDRLLRSIAESVRTPLRSTDVVARMGGDEFAILLVGAGVTEALEVTGRLTEEVSRLARDGVWPGSVSIGVATYETPPDGLDQVLSVVDALMYQAKAAGKATTLSRVIA